MNHVTGVGVAKTIVTFKIKAQIGEGETVGIVGNIDELKNWDPQKAILLSADTNYIGKEDGGLIPWTVDVELPTNVNIKYKYLIKSGQRLIKFEGFKESRQLYTDGFGMCVDDSEFGHNTLSNDRFLIDQGWLADPNEIRLILLLVRDEEGKKPIQFYDLPDCKFNTTVTPLSTLALSDDYLVNFDMKKTNSAFVLMSHARENLSFSLEVKDEHSGASGKCLVLWSEMQRDKGVLIRPLLNSSLSPVGEICIHYLLVKPFVHTNNNFSIIPSKEEEKQFLIGHRGLGTTKSVDGSGKSPLSSKFIENTLIAFMTAARLGAKYIEFDVQLTRDWVPIIVHDEEIVIKTSTQDKRSTHIRVPVNKLNYNEICQLKAFIVRESYVPPIARSSPTTRRERAIKRSQSAPTISEFDVPSPPMSTTRSMQHDETAHHVWDMLDTYPSLKETFQHVHKDVGFNIEIKYPDSEDMERYFAVAERNIYVDTILKVIFDFAQDRKCIISSFDPDICYLVAAKQVRYPVFFLTEGGTIKTTDSRKNSVEAAIHFAQTARLFGIVCDNRPILADLSLIKKCHEANLLLFTYGDSNTIFEYVKIQKENGVDSVITDDVIQLSKKLLTVHLS